MVEAPLIGEQHLLANLRLDGKTDGRLIIAGRTDLQSRITDSELCRYGGHRGLWLPPAEPDSCLVNASTVGSVDEAYRCDNDLSQAELLGCVTHS